VSPFRIEVSNGISGFYKVCSSFSFSRIFGPKLNDGTGDCTKLQNEELHNLYSSPDIIEAVMVTCSAYSVDEKYVHNFVGELEGKRALGRHRRRCERNIEIGLKAIGFGDVNWIYVAQNRNFWWFK
jgi:hypothetical protein